VWKQDDPIKVSPRKIRESLPPKQNKSKTKFEDLAQVIESLPSKCKDLGSIHSTTKKKRKRKRNLKFQFEANQ
jgi:hypothetical protein